MNRIYCKNCKYYDHHGSCQGDDSPLFTLTQINHKGERQRDWINRSTFLSLFELPSDASSGDIYKHREMCTPNKNMDCPVYQRKWYKFWIQPKSNVDKLRIMLESLK